MFWTHVVPGIFLNHPKDLHQHVLNPNLGGLMATSSVEIGSCVTQEPNGDVAVAPLSTSLNSVTPLPERPPSPSVKDPELDRTLCDILGSTFIQGGGLSKEKTYELLLARPVDFRRLGKPLAQKLDRLGGATVIAGVDVMGIELAGHVISAFDELQQGFAKAPVLRLPLGVNDGKPHFPCSATHLFKGASVILILPVITPADWELIVACIQFLDSLKNNATIVGVGAIISYGEPPNSHLRLRDLPRASLLEVRGL